MADALTDLLTDLRQAQPTLESYYEFEPWLQAISQVIAAYPTELRRKACALLVGNDLCVRTGVPLVECSAVVWKAVEQRMAVAS